MYMSKWELEDGSTYYQATVSLKENLTPFFKIRIIPLPEQKEYNLVIRDYNSDLLLVNINIKMDQRNDDVYTNLDTTKKAIERMVRIYLTSVGGVCMS